MIHRLARSNITILLCLAVVAAGAIGKQPLVVGTYAYPNIDRKAAITPLAKLIEDTFSMPMHIVVAESPTELANKVENGQVNIAVPNLVGYALIAAQKPDIFVMAVPDNEGSTYTSSIVSNTQEHSLIEIISHTSKPIGMVWPDSTSGAIVASAYLKQKLAKLPNITYLQSHQNVLDAFDQNTIDIGVLATKVFLQGKADTKRNIVELWRSAPIPYGPIVCGPSIQILCTELRALLLNESNQSVRVLDGLKLGWVEFEASSTFVLPDTKAYEPFVEHFSNSK